MTLDEVAGMRRSVRHYADSALSADDVRAKLEEILGFVGESAPSWKNSQTHRYYVAVSAEKIAEVRDSLVERNRPKCDNAVALIVSAFVKDTSGFSDVDGKKVADNELGNCWGAYDLGLSDSLLLLKARDAGLDTLIMGLRDSAALRKSLCIPADEEVCAVISVGVRGGEAKKPPRKALSDIAHFM